MNSILTIKLRDKWQHSEELCYEAADYIDQSVMLARMQDRVISDTMFMLEWIEDRYPKQFLEACAALEENTNDQP